MLDRSKIALKKNLDLNFLCSNLNDFSLWDLHFRICMIDSLSNLLSFQSAQPFHLIGGDRFCMMKRSFVFIHEFVKMRLMYLLHFVQKYFVGNGLNKLYFPKSFREKIFCIFWTIFWSIFWSIFWTIFWTIF